MIVTYGDSKIGLVRKLNEDAINLDIPGLLILADGMGGYEGGEIASTIAVRAAADFFSKDPQKPFSEETLKESVLCANEAILVRKEENPKLCHMGTTLVMGAVQGDTLYWAHVGDSRLYVWQEGKLAQITVDHSFVMELVKEGKLSMEEMRHHPRKNEITRAVGIDRTLQVDTGTLSLGDGSLLLLCSDGLSGVLTDEEMNQFLTESPKETEDDLHRLGDQLMHQVYESGARDNVSLILAWYRNVE